MQSFYIGESEVYDTDVIVNINLLIGSKNSPVGTAFANGLTISNVETPSTIVTFESNMPCKPSTLLIPIIIGDIDFELANSTMQSAIAHAVNECLKMGKIDQSKINEWIIVVKSFLYLDSIDTRKIYSVTYEAMLSAIDRALTNYPSFDEINKAQKHDFQPGIGVSSEILTNSPFIQVALDLISSEEAQEIVSLLPSNEKILIEAGTPLIKACGLDIISELREIAPTAFIIADLKTLDVGSLEVQLAVRATADAIALSGLASDTTLNQAIETAMDLTIFSIVDLMNIQDPVARLKLLKNPPDIALFHRAIDDEGSDTHAWGDLARMKAAFPKTLVAVAGGVNPESAPIALKGGADIIVVGRYITQSDDVASATYEFLDILDNND